MLEDGAKAFCEITNIRRIPKAKTLQNKLIFTAVPARVPPCAGGADTTGSKAFL